MATSKVVLLFREEGGTAHYEVLSYPKREMEGTTPAELADEMAALTHRVEWRRKHRRAVGPGDLIKIGKDTYDYTDGIAGIPLDIWPHLGIELI